MKLLKNLKSDPKILTDIVEEVRNEKIRISEAVEGEGRCGSLKDEGTIIRFLKTTKLSKYILSEKARKFGDMIVLDYDCKTEYVVNIKTSIGKCDNATSKIGFVYAFNNNFRFGIHFQQPWLGFYWKF